MYAMQNNPYQKYKQQSIMTMTQGEMLTQLFDKAINQLTLGAQQIAAKEYSDSNRTLQKAQAIFNYLRQNLNTQYEVAQGLDQLYEYFLYRIVQANIKQETQGLEEIIPMVTELRNTFVEADRTARMH